MTDKANIDGVRAEEELGKRAKDLAQDAAEELAEKANRSGARGLKAIGERLDEAATYMEEHIEDPHGKRVTEQVHQAATYLQKTDPKSMLGDLDQSIQRHPYRAMAVALGVGWVVGRLMRRSD